MTTKWSTSQVRELAPDAASVNAAKKLASGAKWPLLEHNDSGIWGECKGSGSKPYQTRIDLSQDEPAFKCSCPSRKFPCKHALALFLLYAGEPDLFTVRQEPPPWVSEWLDSRRDRLEKRQAKQAERAETIDPKAQARRTAQRESRIREGLDVLEVWMQDLMRQGLAAVQEHGYRYWEEMAARMVDAQAPGLASRLRGMAGISASGAGWQERLLEAMARLHLIIQGYRRLEGLDAGLEQDLRGLIGWQQGKNDLLREGAGIKDRWLVAGQWIEQSDDELLVQRIWLQRKKHGQFALLLNFAHPKAITSLDLGYQVGSVVDAELFYYESARPLRAVAKDRPVPVDDDNVFPVHEDFSSVLDEYRRALTAQPWLERWPVTIEDVMPVLHHDRVHLVDSKSAGVSFAPGSRAWEVFALSKGEPVTVFGEWRGDSLLPLSVRTEERFVDVAPERVR